MVSNSEVDVDEFVVLKLRSKVWETDSVDIVVWIRNATPA